MPTANPHVRYYVGRFDKGTKHRVIRQTKTKGLFGRCIEQVYERGPWKATKLRYVKVSAYVPTRAQARNLKQQLDAR